MYFWSLQIDTKTNKFFVRISALASKKRSNQKSSVQVNLFQKLLFLHQKVAHWFTSSYTKTTSSEHVVYIHCFFVFVLTFKTIYVHNMFWACSFHVRTGKSMNNLLSYCGLVDARIRGSDKDLPVTESK